MYHICILFLQLHFTSLLIKKIVWFGWALWICLKVRCVVPYKLSRFMFTISFIYFNHVHWSFFINTWEIVILTVLLWILHLLVLLCFIVYSYIWYRLLILLVSLKRLFLLEVSLMIFYFCQLRFCLFCFLDICLESLLLLYFIFLVFELGLMVIVHFMDVHLLMIVDRWFILFVIIAISLVWSLIVAEIWSVLWMKSLFILNIILTLSIAQNLLYLLLFIL